MSQSRWSAPDAYERYMGRWSRRLARELVTWIGAPPGAHWLEIGCGTGALTAAICEHAAPASVVACDPSAPFVEHARAAVADPRASFVVIAPDAGALPRRAGAGEGAGAGAGFDVIASNLVLNFVPDPARALGAMRERLRPGGVVAAAVWDYDGGVELLHALWQEAAATDPAAATADEARRFGAWKPESMSASFTAAGLAAVATGALTIDTTFADFDDYWIPFLGGTGPAPTYVASLDDARRESLRARLERRLTAPAGLAAAPIRLRARAWVARGTAP